MHVRAGSRQGNLTIGELYCPALRQSYAGAHPAFYLVCCREQTLVAFVPDTRHDILHKAEGPLPKQHEAQVAALLQAPLPEMEIALHSLHVL